MNLIPSKESLKKYVFEIIVIFIGITLGFLFDEWRAGRAEEKQRIELRQSMEAELLRIKDFFASEDSAFQDQSNSIKIFISQPEADSVVLFLLSDLTREVSFLQGTFSHVNALTRSNASRIANNITIARNLSYIGNMEADLIRIKSDTRTIIYGSLWPLITKHEIDNDVYLYQNEGNFEMRGDYLGFRKEPLTSSSMRLLTFKLGALSGISKAIMDRIDEILKELRSFDAR